jgi:hypothetical protein
VNQGNTPPLFLTREHLNDFVRVFPLEIHDIQSNHRVLFGADPVSRLKISKNYLSMELNHEFQGKLLRLKTRFMLAEAKPKLVLKLMVDSFSTFLVLLKNALWLFGVKPPMKKMEALGELHKRVKFDMGVFETLERLKYGEKVRDLDVLATFDKYLTALEELAAKISSR